MPTLYTCPVCDYDQLREPPADFYICPSCGTEFDYDDSAATDSERRQRHAELRARWIAKGRPWFSRAKLPTD